MSVIPKQLPHKCVLTEISAHFTVGATSDSGYEYFLKQWIMTGDEQAKEQCSYFLCRPI